MDEPADEVYLDAVARVSPEQWDALAVALRALVAAGPPYAEWSSTAPHEPGGPNHFPFPRYSREVQDLRRALIDAPLEVAFDWMRWPGFTDHWDAERFANGTVVEAMQLIVTALRGERFSDGYLEALLIKGTLQAAVGRLLEARSTPD